MQIKTKNFGTVDFSSEEIITFKEGLYGFEDYKQYLLIDDDKASFFKYLQNIEKPDLCFVLTDPKELIKNYTLTIQESEFSCLKSDNNAQLQDFVIVTIPEDINDISVNLLGPVLINFENNYGRQVISQNSEYTTRHKILKNLKKLAS